MNGHRRVVAAWIVSTVILGLTPLFVVGCGAKSSNQFASHSTVYDQVLKSNKIRAGYVNYPPGTIVDPKTKVVSGIFPDLLRRVGKITGLEVEFVEEVGWATLIEGLETGRYDIIGGVWANPNRGKTATLSKPVFFSGVEVWVRENESRFTPDRNWASIDLETMKIGAIDGSTPLNIAKEQFPRAKLVTYPNLTTEAQLFLDLVAKKIDVFFAESAQGLLFLKNNPGTVKNVAASRPLRVFGHVFLMKRDEFQFKNMLDTALDDLQGSGVVDELLNQYEPAPGAFYRRANEHAVPPRSP